MDHGKNDREQCKIFPAGLFFRMQITVVDSVTLEFSYIKVIQIVMLNVTNFVIEKAVGDIKFLVESS